MKTQRLIGLSAIVLTMVAFGCSQNKKDLPETPSNLLYAGLKSAPANFSGVSSDLSLYEFLNSSNPIVQKLSGDAKEQLMNTAIFEIRGFMSTKYLSKELTNDERSILNNYLYRLSSMKIFIVDLKSPTHPLRPIFQKLSVQTRNNLISSAVGMFHGFSNEHLMRQELSCQDYERFYKDLLGSENVEIVYPDQNCPCKSTPREKSYSPDNLTNPPCPKTKVVDNYCYDSGSTWTISDCKKMTDATCIICDNGSGTGK